MIMNENKEDEAAPTESTCSQVGVERLVGHDFLINLGMLLKAVSRLDFTGGGVLGAQAVAKKVNDCLREGGPKNTKECECCKTPIGFKNRYEKGTFHDSTMREPCVNCIHHETDEMEMPCNFRTKFL